MNIKSDTHSELMHSATSTPNLKQRSEVNKNYGTNDFDGWVDCLINKIQFTSILDICCGTGNQLLKYAANNRNVLLIGVDISQESLQAADSRLRSIGATGYILKKVAMEDMFDDHEISNQKFDLISCFYGLYYSTDTKKTLEQMIDNLAYDGTILIVGPYGNNNSPLFEIIERHFILPDIVKRSSSTFMEHEVIPILSQYLSINTETFKNMISYPSSKVLMDYWKASTFFSSAHENAILLDIEDHFNTHGSFKMEKHIMACLARRL
ncbi:MAG: methyltransferase domain-containing protein [Nitrospirae bacterium]|nr:methyltransferase domain-containing protein [Nitrospirota bacterium]